MAQDEADVTDHPTPKSGPKSEPESGPESGAQPEAAPALNRDVPHATPDQPLSEPARRALLEAAQRRATSPEGVAPTEHGGPSGPEPTRYGDWEKKGLAVDF